MNPDFPPFLFCHAAQLTWVVPHAQPRRWLHPFRHQPRIG
jgi:hypothetical protein